MNNNQSLTVLSRYETDQANAGPKAKTDIEIILSNFFDAKIVTLHKWGKNKIAKTLNKIIARIYPIIKIHRNELTLIQYPYSSSSTGTRHIKNKVYLIHDLDGLRYNNKKKNQAEIVLLNSGKAIICHNQKMKDYLIANGISSQKIYALELFDYLSNSQKHKTLPLITSRLTVVYAGNLSKQKSPFLRQLESNKMNFTLSLYGNGYEESSNKKIHYNGTASPNDLPSKLSGDLGLIWDGCIDESDENKPYKNYTKYNNPHKLSCYIAAGLPVIVWRKSAIADFVLKNNIGYIISSVYDINKLDLSDYAQKVANIQAIGRKVRKGHYTKKAMDLLLNDIKERL